MKPLATWLARLVIAGAFLFVTGCGGSDVPDASSEGQAATDGGGAPAVAPAAPAPPIEGDKVAQAEETPKTEEVAAEPAAAAPSPAPAQEEETPAAPSKPAEGKGNSSTAEMLALATSPSSGGADAAPSAGSSAPSAGGPVTPGSAAPGAAPGAMMPGPGGAGGPMMGPGAGRGAMGLAGMAAPGGPGMPGAPGMMPGGPGAMPRMPGMGPGNMPGGVGGPGGGRGLGMGGPGGMPGLGGPGQNNGPADFHSPQGAVKAFLSALKAKDLDRLNEATALRAQVEAGSSRSQELFKKIFDLSLSDSELDKLAEQLDGYTVSGENPQKSTGRVEVILRKTGKNGAYFLRKVTVRHEKKGWGVLDIAGAMEFKSMGTIRRNTGSGGRR